MTHDWNCLIYERLILMIVHIVCMFDDNCPEEASAPGIKPERLVRRSETTEFQYEGREYAMSDILDTPLPATYARISKRRSSEQISNRHMCFFTELFPSFISAHTAKLVRIQESKAVSNDCPPPGAIPPFNKNICIGGTPVP